MSIASTYPRLASLCITIHATDQNVPYVDPTELADALARKSLSGAFRPLTGNVPPPIPQGYYPWEVEKELRRFANVPSPSTVFP